MNKMLKLFSFWFLLVLCIPLVSPFNATTHTNLMKSQQNVPSDQRSEPTTITNLVQMSNSPVLTSDTMTGAWQQLGPMPLNNPNNIFTWGSAPYSGRITAIAINNSNPQEIYIGAAQGGVWKTLDGGSHWIPLMDNQNSLAVGSLAISPDSHTLYVGTGEGNHGADNYAGIGLLKSIDEGQTFSVLGANYFNGSAISSIVVNSNNPSIILVSTTYAVFAKGLGLSQNPNGLGVYLSTDGGSTWSLTLTSSLIATDGVADLVANASNPNIIYAGDFDGTIWVSTNAGSSWSSYLYYSNSADQGRIALAVTPANASLLYAVFVNSTGEVLSMLAYDGVNFYTFNSLPTPGTNQYGPCGGQCWYDILIAVDPTNVNTFYVGTNNLYKTIDGGNTWSLLGGAVGNGNLHPDQHAFAFSPSNPSTIYSGNDGGIYKSTNAGTSWVSLNTNLGITQFDSISASPTDDAHLIGGVQDNACDIYTNSTSWTIAAGGDGGASAFYNDSVMACNYVNLAPRFSIDNGLSFFTLTSGLTTSDPSQFYAPMVQDPSDPATFYLGSDRIYRFNTNTDNSWSDISGVISAGTITSISVSKTNGNILYEGDSKGVVEVSTNGGSSWNSIFSTTNFFSKNIAITSVAVDPYNSSIIVVAIANQTSPRLFYSVDQGVTWYYFYLTELPDVAINVIKFNPVTDVPFIGTDRGVYYLNDTGYWNQLGTGLPNAAIFDLTFTASNYLVVGTHGRGAWLNYMTPFVSVSLRNNTSYKSGKTVTFTITDPNGFSNATFHWDNGVNLTASSTISTSIPISEGVHILYIYAKDPAGNWMVKKFYFRTDNTPPSITLNGITNNSIVDTGTSIDFSINDASPIQSILYNWNGNANTSGTLSNGILTISILGNAGSQVLRIYVEDSATNNAFSTFVFSIKNPSSSATTTTSGPGSSSINPSQSSSNPSKNSTGFEFILVFIALGTIFIRKRRR